MPRAAIATGCGQKRYQASMCRDPRADEVTRD
jgi:hypothetical protein